RRAVLDRNESLAGGSCTVAVGGRDPHVVAVHSDLPCEVAVARISPALNIFIPGIRKIAQEGSNGRLLHCVCNIRRGQQPCYFNRESKGRISGVLFPPVLLCDGTVTRNKTDGPPHHGPPAIQISQRLRCLSTKQIYEQNREGGFIHLQSIPIRTAVQPHILRPAPVTFLRSL